MNITLTIDDDEIIQTTLESFINDNEIESMEESEIRAALNADGVYHGGGGAQPEFRIEPRVE
jgi:hypothetical protein